MRWGDEYNTGYNVYYYDLKTQEHMPVCVKNGTQFYPDIYNNIVVWMDDRDDPTVYDIYMYDIVTGLEKKLTENQNTSEYVSNSYHPTIYGNYIVWVNKLFTGSDNPIKHSTVIYNIETEETNIISTTNILPVVSSNNMSVTSIFGDRALWLDPRKGQSNLYMYDLNTGIETPIGNHEHKQLFHDTYGSWVVWEEDSSDGADNGSWIYNVETGEINLLSDNLNAREPRIYRDTVVWLESSTMNLHRLSDPFGTNHKIYDTGIVNRLDIFANKIAVSIGGPPNWMFGVFTLTN